MGQSLVKNYIHIIFSTKNRENYINQEIELEVFSYIASLCKSMDCAVQKVGGYNNHIHIMCSLSKNHTLVELIRVIKSNSSKWISEKFSIESFSWQTGYGTFSVSPKDIQLVIDYIAQQKEHHKIKSFQEEFLVFLHKYNMDYNDKHIWE